MHSINLVKVHLYLNFSKTVLRTMSAFQTFHLRFGVIWTVTYWLFWLHVGTLISPDGTRRSFWSHMTRLDAGIHVFVRSLKVYCWGRNVDECGSWLLNASLDSVVVSAAGAPWFTGSLTFSAFTLTSSRNYSNPYVLFDRNLFLKSVLRAVTVSFSHNVAGLNGSCYQMLLL